MDTLHDAKTHIAWVPKQYEIHKHELQQLAFGVEYTARDIRARYHG